jgi:hypothetical protein
MLVSNNANMVNGRRVIVPQEENYVLAAIDLKGLARHTSSAFDGAISAVL